MDGFGPAESRKHRLFCRRVFVLDSLSCGPVFTLCVCASLPASFASRDVVVIVNDSLVKNGPAVRAGLMCALPLHRRAGSVPGFGTNWASTAVAARAIFARSLSSSSSGSAKTRFVVP